MPADACWACIVRDTSVYEYDRACALCGTPVSIEPRVPKNAERLTVNWDHPLPANMRP